MSLNILTLLHISDTTNSRFWFHSYIKWQS